MMKTKKRINVRFEDAEKLVEFGKLLGIKHLTKKTKRIVYKKPEDPLSSFFLEPGSDQ